MLPSVTETRKPSSWLATQNASSLLTTGILCVAVTLRRIELRLQG